MMVQGCVYWFMCLLNDGDVWRDWFGALFVVSLVLPFGVDEIFVSYQFGFVYLFVVDLMVVGCD